MNGICCNCGLHFSFDEDGNVCSECGELFCGKCIDHYHSVRAYSLDDGKIKRTEMVCYECADKLKDYIMIGV